MTADWCPECRERSTVSTNGVCLFCDTPLVEKAGGWKRPDKRARFTDAQLTVLYRAYVADRSLSVQEIGRRVWARVGYSSPESAAVALAVQWRRRGWPVRDRLEQAAAVPREPRPDARLCAGVKRQKPRKGQRCRKYARIGSDFCREHDPNLEVNTGRAVALMVAGRGRAV